MSEQQTDPLSHASLFTTISMMANPAKWIFFLNKNPVSGDDKYFSQCFDVMVFWQTHRRLPLSLDEIYRDQEVISSIENMKTNMRRMLLDAVNSELQAEISAEAQKWQKRQAEEAARQRNMLHAGITIKERMKPAQEGTVAELAEKYGKSKSEIRRLKREGLLHTLEEDSAA